MPQSHHVSFAAPAPVHVPRLAWTTVAADDQHVIAAVQMAMARFVNWNHSIIDIGPLTDHQTDPWSS